MISKIEYQVINNISIGISIFIYKNKKLKLVGVNKKLEDLFGINKTELENNNITPFLHPKDKQIIENSLKIAENTNNNINFSARYYNYKKNNYSYFNVETNITFLENKTFKIYITFNNKLLENSIIHDKKIIDNILNFVVKHEFDYLARADYKKNEYIVYFNDPKLFKSFEKKAVLTIEEFLKLISLDISDHNNSFNSKKITLKTILKSLKKTGCFKRYYKIIDKNKNNKIKEIRISNINLGKGIFYIARRDITDFYNENEKKNIALEEALKLAENANESKTMFLSTMSHDIKTPMNAIIGMTDLSYGLIRKDDFQLKKNLDIIKASSKTLMNIINEVLYMNRLNNGQVKFISKKFEINDLKKSILEYFMPAIELKKQKISIHLNVIHNFLVGDIDNIEKILYGLIENAIKYTPKEGKIDISIDEIKVINRKDITFFKIKIKDNGIGILKEDQNKIFEPFHRGKNVGDEKGTGLGLSIIRSVLELRGSELKIESEIGKGTTVSIEISFEIDNNYKNNLKELNFNNLKTELNFNNKKVLIVEDNEINRLIIRKNLERYNLIVEEAINGEDGYNKFINSPKNYYSLIFMDIRMPFLDGFSCTKKIRNSNHPNSKKIKIIALTANTFARDKNLCFESGMNDYIEKPINVLYLKEILEKYLKV